MARITKCYCDKCNKEIKEREAEAVYFVKYSYYDGDYMNNVTKELCEECAETLNRYLNNVPEWV